MQISLQWIQELVNLQKLSLDDLIQKLTLGGFEVEDVLEIKIDDKQQITLDLSATANRSDSLSIQGLSLEVASLLNQNLKTSLYSTEIYSWEKDLESFYSRNLEKTECFGFITILVENLSDCTSPKWIQQKLVASGISPQNNFIDFQNYIALETGYPLEFYDFQRICSKLNQTNFQFHLKSSNDCFDFQAKNNIHYKLDKSILTINADELPISIAGIITSHDTNVLDTTEALLVEGSIFNATKIRQESRFLGLRTDRSARYEKSLKNLNLFKAVYRLISLLRIKNPKLICKLHTLEQLVPDKLQVINLNYQKIKQILGPIRITENSSYEYISPKLVTELLERLKFDGKYNKDESNWQVKIPALRSSDITQEIDLIEEIGRIYGFNNFLTRLPEIKTIGLEDSSYQVRKKLTSSLIHLGLNELVQYSLVKRKTYSENEVKLVNPLVKDYSYLRSSLLPNLVESLDENLRKGNLLLEGFEYGHVFSTHSNLIIEETEKIAGVFGGVSIKWNWSEKSRLLDWFEAKGKIDQLFKRLNISIDWESYEPIREKEIFHPYRTAQVFTLNQAKLGIFGQISPILAKRLNISTATYLFEFNFELIQNQLQINKLASYQEYSLYPKIVKDLSFIIKDDIRFQQIEKVLFLNGTEFLKEVCLLDEYRGKSIPEKHTSLCLQLVFQSNYQTLKTKKIEQIMSHLIKILSKKFNTIIRS